MKRIIVLILLIATISNGTSWAERELDRPEILQIIQLLTNQPRKSWIPHGTISAIHHEYGYPKEIDEAKITDAITNEIQAYIDKPDQHIIVESLQQMKLEAIPFNARYRLSNRHEMTSNVIINYDGNRFRWEILVDSRTDTIKRPPELQNNAYTENFAMRRNKDRVFAWDGEKYTIYFKTGKHAVIDSSPSGVNGPLTAGVIPWGYGNYTYSNLAWQGLSATELEIDGKKEIHLNILWANKEQAIVLDPTKEYAVKSHSTINNGIVTECDFGGYQSVTGIWCPSTILIEKRPVDQLSRLLERDYWQLTQVDGEMPVEDSWVVDFEYDTFVEDYRFGTSPLQYHYSPPAPPSAGSVDLEEMARLQQSMLHDTISEKQNCATSCLKYAFGKLGKDVSWERLAPMVHGDEKATSMSEMVRFARNSGLTAVTVKADLESIRMLKGCEIVLHLPQTNHYVLLGATDAKFARIADLTTGNFYRRYTNEHLNSIWEGTAMILSSSKIAGTEKLAKIDDNMLNDIVGAAECSSCTNTIQDASNNPCSSPTSGSCGGTHKIYYERKGCENSESSSDSCSPDPNPWPTHLEADCIDDPNSPGDCTNEGNWEEMGTISACS